MQRCIDDRTLVPLKTTDFPEEKGDNRVGSTLIPTKIQVFQKHMAESHAGLCDCLARKSNMKPGGC